MSLPLDPCNYKNKHTETRSERYLCFIAQLATEFFFTLFRDVFVFLPFLQWNYADFTNIHEFRNSTYWLFQQTVINIISIEILEELVKELFGAVWFISTSWKQKGGRWLFLIFFFCCLSCWFMSCWLVSQALLRYSCQC